MTRLEVAIDRDNVSIPENASVVVKHTGDITEIRTVRPVKTMQIKILSRDEVRHYGLDTSKKWYQKLGDGEVLECKVSESRQDNFEGILASISKLRDIINVNVVNRSSVRWITLTYRQRESDNQEATPMRDCNRLYLDYKHFIARLRADYPNRKIDFIKVAEPQRSGSWHLHVIMIFDGKAPFIRNDVLREKYWQQGFVDIQSVGKNCDNIGAYFSAYLTNIEYQEGDVLADGEEIIEFENQKKYIKGGRLKFYPPGFNLYSCSRGIKRPIEEESTFGDVDISSLGTLTDVKEVILYNEDTNLAFTYKYMYFNKRRKPQEERLESIRSKLRT